MVNRLLRLYARENSISINDSINTIYTLWQDTDEDFYETLHQLKFEQDYMADLVDIIQKVENECKSVL